MLMTLRRIHGTDLQVILPEYSEWETRRLKYRTDFVVVMASYIIPHMICIYSDCVSAGKVSLKEIN